MRRLVLSMLVGMMALGAMAQGSVFTVQGRFDGRGDSVKFQLVDWGNKLLYEEARAVTGDMLEVTFDLKDAKAPVLFVDNGTEGYMRHHVIPAIPGDTVLFYEEGTPGFRLAGSQFYLDYDEAVQTVEPHFIEFIEKGFQDDQFMKLYNSLESAILNYVKTHPDQEAAAALMAIFADEKDVERGAAMLTERVINSVAANLYKAVIAATKEE